MTTTISKKQEDIFDYANNYSKRPEWDPFIKEYQSLTPNLPLGKGYQVFVKSRQGVKMNVEYISFIRPKHVTMKMISGPFWFKKFSGYWQFADINETETKVIFGYKFDLISILKPFGFVVRQILSREIRARLKGLKALMEKESVAH